MKIRLLFSFFAVLLLTSIHAQITTVGLIGPAQAGGWDTDTDMIQDAVDTNLWTLDILLVDGDAKFRANDDWAINWGATNFPIGVGTQNGPNIPARGGLTHITFNSATGAYYFSVASDIGIIGSAAPFSWDADVNMYQSASDTNEYSITLELGIGEVKFRANDDWAINWGATDFPSGVGTQNGPNIPIAVASEYAITFNKSTGAYNFTNVGFSTIGIIGDATPGGSTPTEMTSVGPKQWELAVELNDGGLQFSGDNGVAIWGGTDFPSGTATLNGGEIPVTAGRYVVHFNNQTLEYEFEEVVYYSAVGIIGDATPGGWDSDTDMHIDPLGADSSDWVLRIILTDGELKFRANDDWAVNWGAATFPTGTATLEGPNIPVTAGDYEIHFNTFTGNYNFIEKRVYASVGLIGPATPFGDWATDYQMTKDATDENLWKVQSVDLVDGEAKFRAEGAWAVNWGSTSWPTGIGTQDGPNIPIVGGTYGITLNAETGEYAFGDPLTSTKDLLDPSSISVWPNPASDVLQIDLSAIDMQEEVTLNVFDFTGKLVLSQVKLAEAQMQLNVSTLHNGHFMLQISNDRYIIGKKFAVTK